MPNEPTRWVDQTQSLIDETLRRSWQSFTAHDTSMSFPKMADDIFSVLAKQDWIDSSRRTPAEIKSLVAECIHKYFLVCVDWKIKFEYDKLSDNIFWSLAEENLIKKPTKKDK